MEEFSIFLRNSDLLFFARKKKREAQANAIRNSEVKVNCDLTAASR